MKAEIRFSISPLFLAVALFVFLGLFSVEAGGKSVDRPNVILLIADDLNDAVEGFSGHEQAATPHIARLAEQGTRFLNAHANAPICGPSRASFLTGLHPLTSGLYGHRQQVNHWRNNAVLKDAVTFLEHFKSNGYKVYGTGKIYHNGHEDDRVWTDLGEPASFGPYPWDGVYKTPWGAIGWQPHPALPEPLRKEWGQGFGPLSQIPEYASDPVSGAPGYRGWVLGDGPFRYESETERDLVPDELNTKYVVDLLEQSHAEPFFIACGFNRPHTPLYAPKEYFDRFPLESIKLPPWLENDLDDVPTAFSTGVTQGSDRDVGPYKFRALMEAGGEEMWKKWIQAYLACVALVDDQVGAVMAALEASPFKDNTIVILVGDHGYHMGEKNYLFKNSLWEEGTRVPFIVNLPGGAGTLDSVSDPVSLVDLYPTLVDLCGLADQPNVKTNGLPLDGRSLAAYALKGATPKPLNWYEGALLAVAGDQPLELDEAGPADDQHWSLRTRRYRYTLANTGEEELYDHQNDPHEWKNLADDPAVEGLKQRLKKELLDRITKGN